MSASPALIYRKTAAGVQAVGGRAHTLPSRVRTMLILVNGRDSVTALIGLIGPEAPSLIEVLLGLGLVETVAPVSLSVSGNPLRTQVLATRLRGANPAPAATTLAPVPARAQLSRLQLDALRLLAPQFGPDVDVVCASLLAAATVPQFELALQPIEARLAIYIGRRSARSLLASLRP